MCPIFLDEEALRGEGLLDRSTAHQGRVQTDRRPAQSIIVKINKSYLVSLNGSFMGVLWVLNSVSV
jgi:hypothetical protein